MADPGNTQYFSCCRNCKSRSPACFDRCIDYIIAKATKGAMEQLERERYIGHRRATNGRK